ncbi:hypothetical protein, partial [Candidatus Deferrimicrobium sp.]|uniref:hypothetical protein n=1 Tax=Candidatus Deferrimicrobium sp. TaxID=3060586 RepID=UPI002ED682B0
MNDRILMQGNDAIARGLVEAGCAVAASYPGTPASEILSSIPVAASAIACAGEAGSRTGTL